jgi:hypothetical protein
MPLDFIIGAAVGAGLASSPVRKTIRKGVVYSLAGALMAYDKVAGMASDIRKSRSQTPAAEAPKTSAPEANATCESSPGAKPAAPAEPAATR